jgi:hypothetical protein
MLLPGEYIIKEMYDIYHPILHPNDIIGNLRHSCYLSNFGNMHSIDSDLLTWVFDHIQVWLRTTRRGVPSCHERKNHELRILGTNPLCLCNSQPNAPERQYVTNYESGNCTTGVKDCHLPYFKWTCNDDKLMNDDLITKIIDYDFQPSIPYNIEKLRNTFQSGDNVQQFLSAIEDYNFGKKLMDNVTKFIQQHSGNQSESIPIAQPVQLLNATAI